MKELLRKNGDPTAYGLACGYTAHREIGNIKVTLWKEHEAFHVRAYEFEGRGRLYWESFSALGEAYRAFFEEAKRCRKK